MRKTAALTVAVPLVVIITSAFARAPVKRVPAQGTTALVCDVTASGAVPDGKTLNTAAIQAAVEKCGANPGGGVVLFPKNGSGVYLSGTISVLHDNITIQIEAGATLQGVQGGDPVYPPLSPDTTNSQLLNCRKALIYAYRVHNLTIEGPGTIDGGGTYAPWGGTSKEATRPMAIFVVQSGQTPDGQAEPAGCSSNGSAIGAGAPCGGVTIRNLSVNNAGMWSVVMMESDHVHVNQLSVYSPNGPTRDGIDIVDGHHVLIENSKINSEDDSICLKSGIARGTVDFLARNDQVLRSIVANGLKIGTATTGVFQDITFENDTVTNVNKAAMAVESVDGGAIKNVVYRNITFHQAGTGFFIILGARGGEQVTPGSIDGVTFQNIKGDQMTSTWGSALSGTLLNGTTYSPSNVTFDNVQVAYQPLAGPVPAMPPEYAGQYPDPNLWENLPGKALFVRHIKNLILNGTQFTMMPGASDARPYVSATDWGGTIPPALLKP